MCITDPKVFNFLNPQDVFQETSLRPFPGDVLKMSEISSRLFLVKAKDYLETMAFLSTYVLNYLHITTPSLARQTNELI